jgi:curved DNA-binding protein CbpA
VPASSHDPYRTLGVSPGASDAEVRAAYRRLVQLHHPDHNNGSAESARKFEQVQDAYAEVRRLRAAGGPARGAGARPSRTRPGRGGQRRQPPPSASDPDLDARLADLERQLREANLARERARRAAREAAAASAPAAGESEPPRASDEDLGYVSTDDSFSKILADARDELFGRATDVRDDVRENVRERRVGDRVADLIDELAAKLRGDPPDKG